VIPHVSCRRNAWKRPFAALAMNLELLEPAIAPHSSGTRQSCASRPFRLISGSFAMSPFATAAFALDPQEAITQFVWEPGNLDSASSIISGAE
jgi:hypothetical protein